MTNRNDVQASTASTISTGAGVAIAGIWLAATALSIFTMLTMFVWGSVPSTSTANSEDAIIGLVITIFLIAAPLIAAYSITKKIIDKED